MIKKYGKPTKVTNKKTTRDNSGRIIEDSVDMEWITGNEEYHIYYSTTSHPMSQKIGTVSLTHRVHR